MASSHAIECAAYRVIGRLRRILAGPFRRHGSTA